MDPVKLVDNNFWLGVDQRGVKPISATRWINRDGDLIISTGFQPSADELARLNQGLPVILHVRGELFPPVVVSVGEPIQATTADEG